MARLPWFALPIVLAAGCAKSVEWKALTLDDAGVAIEMPAGWREEALGSDGRKYEARGVAAEYAVVVQTLPANVKGREALNQARAEVAKWLPGGRVVSEEFGDVGGLPGTVFILEASDSASARVRSVVSRGRLVSLVVAQKGSAQGSADAQRFLDSLKGSGTAAAAAESRPVAATEPVAAKADRRTAWRYENAPTVFDNQSSFAGVIRKRGNAWLDETANGVVNDFVEAARTTEYVELKRPGAEFRLRLYADKSEYKMGPNDWKPMYPGRWEE